MYSQIFKIEYCLQRKGEEEEQNYLKMKSFHYHNKQHEDQRTGTDVAPIAKTDAGIFWKCLFFLFLSVAVEAVQGLQANGL